MPATYDWEVHKEEIQERYLQSTLAEVRAYMKETHGFNASIRSYRNHLRQWQLVEYFCAKREARSRQREQRSNNKASSPNPTPWVPSSWIQDGVPEGEPALGVGRAQPMPTSSQQISPQSSTAPVSELMTVSMWQGSVARAYEEGMQRSWDYDSELIPGLTTDSGYAHLKKPAESTPEIKTDSGYASIKKMSGSSKEPPVPIEHVDDTQQPQSETDDCASLYSTAQSIPAGTKMLYESDISVAILDIIQRQDSDTAAVGALRSTLSSLLQSFALRLGAPGSSKIAIEAMQFVHRRRNEIAALVQGDADKSFPADEAATESSLGATHASDPPVKRDIAEWISQVRQSDMTDINLNCGADLSWDESMEQLVAADEVDDGSFLPYQQAYRDAVLNSVAYKWLTAAIVRTITLAPVGDIDICAQFKSNISKCLKRKRFISRSRASERYKMLFIAAFNPTSFFCEKFPDVQDLKRVFEETLTLTGSVTDAQVLPCAEYLRQTWSTTGPILLTILKDALVSKESVSGDLGDSTTVRCQFQEGQLEVQVEGTADSISIVGEQIGWMGAALRRPCSQDGLTTCYPLIRISTSSTGPPVCSIDFVATVYSSDVYANRNGECWHGLFQNPVVVLGYPIPRRAKPGSGLELPLEVMSGITECPRISQYMGHHLLKGFSTALVPIEISDDAILWHYYYSTDGSRLPYPDPGRIGIAKADLGQLAKARHIVGWCSEAKFYAGAPGMNYSIGVSQLKRPGRDFVLEKITFSAGQFVTAGCQFSIGRKEPHVHITRGSFKKNLSWIDQQYVTLWDVVEERGWLISGTAALLHLLRMSLESLKKDKFSSAHLFEEEKFQESSRPLSLASTLDVLLNPINQKLVLDVKDERSFTETTILPNGEPQSVNKVVSSHTTVKDRIEELYETLELLIDFNAQMETSFKGLNAKVRLSDQLLGWDFADIATDRDPFYLRKADLPMGSTGWVDFTRAIPAITLFGKGFGDIIRASPSTSLDHSNSCQVWETVPKNKNLLCASVADLGAIITRTGDLETDPIEVAPNIFWKNPFPDLSPLGGSCPCITKSACKATNQLIHHTTQEFAKGAFRSSSSESTTIGLADHEHGAVIFGRAPLLTRLWEGVSEPLRSLQSLVAEASTGAEPGNSSDVELVDMQEDTATSLSTSATLSSSSQSQGTPNTLLSSITESSEPSHLRASHLLPQLGALSTGDGKQEPSRKRKSVFSGGAGAESPDGKSSSRRRILSDMFDMSFKRSRQI